MSVATIKKNDTVIAISGEDSGRTGKVLEVNRGKKRALVEGLNMVKKALRRTQDNPQGGFADKEAQLALSKVMLYCPVCKKGVRTRRRRDGRKVIRHCAAKGCKHEFDS